MTFCRLISIAFGGSSGPSSDAFPIATVDIGDPKDAAQQIDTDVAAMRMGKGYRRGSGFRHEFVLSTGKRTDITEASQLPYKFPP
jgi:hypothetical protein